VIVDSLAIARLLIVDSAGGSPNVSRMCGETASITDRRSQINNPFINDQRSQIVALTLDPLVGIDRHR